MNYFKGEATKSYTAPGMPGVAGHVLGIRCAQSHSGDHRMYPAGSNAAQCAGCGTHAHLSHAYASSEAHARSMEIAPRPV